MQLRSMIASWLLDTLSREWSWRTALRRIAGELAAMPPGARDHLKVVDVARALEHVEPDRRFAISCYQHAVPELDDGRALLLAVEGGWWPLVCQVAMRERTATGSLEAMVWEARALLDTGDRDRADKLLPRVPSDLRLAALRAELTGGSQVVLDRWLSRATDYTGDAAAEAYLIAARQARALGRPDWPDILRTAAYAEVSHAGAASMLVEHCFGDGRRDSRGLLELLRHRLEVFESRGDLAAWCDATRLAAMRLWLGSGATRHRGLARRLLGAALERAYRDRLSAIPGHLAMWTVLDEAATVDETRTELLSLVVKALDAPLPVADRVWLAILGAEICGAAGNLDAAGAYAAVALAHAPDHPVVKAMMSGAAAPPPPRAAVVELEAFRDALSQLDVEPWQELQIDEIAPLDPDELGLVRGVVTMDSAAALEDALELAVDHEEGRVVLLEEEATEMSDMQKSMNGDSTDDGWSIDPDGDAGDELDDEDGEPHTDEEVMVAAGDGAATVEQVVAEAQRAERRRAESAERKRATTAERRRAESAARRALDDGWGEHGEAPITVPTPRVTTSSLPRLGTAPVRPVSTQVLRLGTEPVPRAAPTPAPRLGTMPVAAEVSGATRASSSVATSSRSDGPEVRAEGTAAGRSAPPRGATTPAAAMPAPAPAGDAASERAAPGNAFSRPGTAPLGSASQVHRQVSTQIAPIAVTPSSRAISTPIAAIPAVAEAAAPAASASAAPARREPRSGRVSRAHQAIAPIRDESVGAPAAVGTARTSPVTEPQGRTPQSAPLALPPGELRAAPPAAEPVEEATVASPPLAAAPAAPGAPRPQTGPSPALLAGRAALRSGPIPVTPSPSSPSPPSPSPSSPSSPSSSSSPSSRPGAPVGIIPSVAKSALGGLRPKPLPPVPPPPTATPRAPRVTVSMDLRLFLGARELVIQSRDVSASGLFAVTAEELPLGEIFDCELSVPSSGLSEEAHRAKLRVVRRSPIGYGCELVGPSPSLAAALTRLGAAIP
jgi:PilZ domain